MKKERYIRVLVSNEDEKTFQECLNKHIEELKREGKEIESVEIKREVSITYTMQ